LKHAPAIVKLDSLGEHQLVMLETPEDRVMFEELEKIKEANPRACVYSTNSPTAQMNAVHAGFGIGILSNRWASMDTSLIRVLPDYTAVETELWLVSHEELRYSARIRAVADFIAERVIADQELFAIGNRKR